MLLQHDPRACLPSAEDLPDSDDTPVDSQLQHLIPGLLEMILAHIWSERMDWFFGVDMGIYYDPYQPAIASNIFLSVAMPLVIDNNLRLPKSCKITINRSINLHLYNKNWLEQS